MNGYFVTGTDTNIGKTYVTCELARRVLAHGRKVFAFKPIESGWTVPEGSDQELLAEAAGNWQTGPLRGLYRFPLPAAPLVAAEAAGEEIDLVRVIHTIRAGATDHHPCLTLVEGAGGWRVPISPEADTSTLARVLGLPILIVGKAGLGTINHTLLTVEAVERDGLAPAAVVLSQRPGEESRATERNREEICRRWGGLVLILDDDPTVLDALLGGSLGCST